MAVRHMPQPEPAPNPERIFQGINAYQLTAAIKTAVEVGLFDAIAEGATSSSEIAQRTHSDARRVRILCDYLTVEGLLSKNDGDYGLASDTATFLVRKSPAYLGDTVRFLLHADHVRQYENLTTIMRHGVPEEASTVAPENDLWVDFARSMTNMMRMPAEAIAQHLGANQAQPWKVLDIAAGHGIFGVTLARHNPQAHVVAVDWGKVLQVARENAEAAGVGPRYSTIAGSAFDVDFGNGYDVVLLTNFLHHFDRKTIHQLLKRVHAALKPGGRAVTLEFVPNDDRISPPMPAKFAMIMLAGTAHGDAYTFAEYQQMFRDAGFANSELVRLHGPESLVIAHK